MLPGLCASTRWSNFARAAGACLPTPRRGPSFTADALVLSSEASTVAPGLVALTQGADFSRGRNRPGTKRRTAHLRWSIEGQAMANRWAVSCTACSTALSVGLKWSWQISYKTAAAATAASVPWRARKQVVGQWPASIFFCADVGPYAFLKTEDKEPHRDPGGWPQCSAHPRFARPANHALLTPSAEVGVDHRSPFRTSHGTNALQGLARSSSSCASNGWWRV